MKDFQYKKAIAFCIYGNHPRYIEGMIRNCIIAPHVFMDWDVVVYHDNTVDRKALNTIEQYGGILIDCTGRRESGMFWRFGINDIAERWISRDADSRLNIRDLAAVNEWIASGRKWHVIRDDVAHTQRVLGGLWGGYRTGVDMAQTLLRWNEFGKYNDDQEFIKDILWPDMQNDVLIHDINTNPIKQERIGHYYLGQVWDATERRW